MRWAFDGGFDCRAACPPGARGSRADANWRGGRERDPRALQAPAGQAPAPPAKVEHLSVDGRFLAALAKRDARQFDAATGKDQDLAVQNAHTDLEESGYLVAMSIH